MKMLNEINDYLTDGTGIFNTIQSAYSSTFTWLSSDDADSLDMEYYLNHSGNKYISLITDKLYEDNSTTYLSNLAKVIVLRYGDKWNRLYEALINATYNPIENYSMIEDENVGSKVTNTTSGNTNVFGFNTASADGVPQSITGGEVTTEGLYNDNTRHLTRSGNIGVTTSQQMIESSVVLYNKWNLYQIMMEDIDSIMCLAYRKVV